MARNRDFEKAVERGKKRVSRQKELSIIEAQRLQSIVLDGRQGLQEDLYDLIITAFYLGADAAKKEKSIKSI